MYFFVPCGNVLALWSEISCCFILDFDALESCVRILGKVIVGRVRLTLGTAVAQLVEPLRY